MEKKNQLCLPLDRANYWIREMRELFTEMKSNCDFYIRKLDEIETVYGINQQKQKIFLEGKENETKNSKDKEL